MGAGTRTGLLLRPPMRVSLVNEESHEHILLMCFYCCEPEHRLLFAGLFFLLVKITSEIRG